MWPIARLTIKEIIYKRVFLVISLMSLALLIFYGIGTYYAQGQIANMNRGPMGGLAQGFMSTQFYGMGLYFAAFITSLLAIFSSVGSISKEIESRQIDPMMARPISRASFVMGRFVGLSLLMVSYSIFLFLGITAVNQFLGNQLKVVVSMSQVLQAGSLFVLQSIIIVAVALFFSTRWSTLNSGIVLIMLYVTSMLGGFIEQLGGITQIKQMLNFGIVTSLLFPIDTLFRTMVISLFESADDPISMATQGIFGSTSAPSKWMLVYIGLYGVMALWFAIRSFQKRDL
ncbi:ABC-type transport system involved in multi-copper enzyme maturation permease subunit [Croceifilum oryzae]|uniref:ABC-type transport system involved in multi-copper enzyme maturation permease subunit n=1 Tax=Croceifilum oryzae TaxID=1553429 RepID=A0AAJ1WRI2_9BACL|nr:ABC transporter permease subunit [Croceifilum oryzae]MDQ0416023.1 ABC-type transport system involved in multi-copper enzyme maturation permease subunit [Croceifilum oryzae]